MTFADHERVHGELPRLSPQELIEAVERSGLRGRGGADFPTARKLRAVAERRRGQVLVVNGSETEPASAKDQLLLSRLPHLVLDGAVLAAAAIGAHEVIVKVGEGAVGSLHALESAISATRRRSRHGSPCGGSRGIRDGRGERGHPLPERRRPGSRRSCRRDRTSAATAAGRR